MSRSELTRVPLSALVEDMDLYPRHAVDGQHVASLVNALAAGEKLPPIVADAKSKRITDGWHRARAHRRHSGPACEVDVEMVEYADEAELLLDAVGRNSAHGRRLDAVDRRRSVLMLRAVGINDTKIGQALRMPAERVERLTISVATTAKSSDQLVPGTQVIALKRSTAHLAGQRLTKQQADVHKTMPGTSLTLIARQLRLALENDLADLTNEEFVAELRALSEVLAEYVSAVA